MYVSKLFSSLRGCLLFIHFTNCPFNSSRLRVLGQNKTTSTRRQRQRLHVTARPREQTFRFSIVSAEDAQLDVVPIHVFRTLCDFQMREYSVVPHQQHNGKLPGRTLLPTAALLHPTAWIRDPSTR